MKKTNKTNKSNKSKKSELKTEARNVYQVVTDKIIAQMEQGIIPWQKPWTYAGAGMEDLRNCAINYQTRKPYSMLNQWLLGFRAGEYLTWKQAEALGGKVKKGAESGMVVFWGQTTIRTRKKRDENDEVVTDADGKPVTEDVMEERIMPVLKYYHVFHIDDIEGIETKFTEEEATQKVEVDPIQSAELIVWEYVMREAKLKFECDKPSDRAYYQPGADRVVVPMISQYKVKEEFYSTAFHELTHSTLPSYRCNRETENKGAYFGNEEYAREELVAEIGSAMLCNVAGLDCQKAFKNSVAYVQGWLKALKSNPKWIVWAAARAEKAARYIQFGPDANAQA